jgi:hypothetical protein
MFEQAEIAVMLQTYVQEVFISNLSWVPAILTESFHSFPQYLQAKCRDSTMVMAASF